MTAHLGAFPTLNNGVSLVELQPHQSINSPLTCRDSTGDELSLWSEEVAVVEDTTKLDCHELVPERSHIPVQGQAFQIHVRHAQDGGTRRLVATAGLDSDKTIFDNIDPADAVLPPERVQRVEDVHGIGVRLFVIRHFDFNGESSFKLDGDALRCLGRIFGSGSKFPHVCRRSDVRVLEDSSLVRNMEKVLISRPGFGGSLGNRDSVFFCVGKKRLSASETVIKFCVWGVGQQKQGLA